jgi:hypothetical protein
MEYSRTEWDLFLWPRTWHNRLNSVVTTLVPGIIIVGLFDMLASSKTIITEFLSASGESGFPARILAFIIIPAFFFALTVVDFTLRKNPS